MREHLYRGKRVDNGEWVYGFYWNRGKFAHYIKVIDENGNLIGDYEVIPETICEFTGLTDKNGKKIFEGDIVTTGATLFLGNLKGVVEYSSTSARYIISFKNKVYHYEDLTKAEVIGNIYDNPELLEK